MRLFGLDQQVMERLLAGAAMEDEARDLGVSVSDRAVADRVRAEPAFRGPTGAFDRDAYAFALRNGNLDERGYETRLRREAAAQIVQMAVTGGVMPASDYATVLAAWLGETRDVTIAAVTAAQLDGGSVAPTEEALQTFYEENAALFETPERRRITYAWADPDTLAAEMPVGEEQVRALYDARVEEFRVPRRVLAERLAFRDAAEAQAAAAAIAAGEETFDDLVAARGLSLADVDQGEIAQADVAPDIAAALFAVAEPGIVGPVDTPLGPALYRINAILDARETPFEDVRDDLAVEAAADEARRRVDAEREAIDDLLASGATLEEVAAETVMTQGTVAYDDTVTDGIAAYQDFREAAANLQDGDFPELVDLSDGGLLALRLDALEPATTPPLDEVRAEVEAAWQSANLRRRLFDRAEALAGRVRDGEAFDALGLQADAIRGIERDGVAEGVPPDLIERIFEGEAGAVIAAPGDDNHAFLIRLDAVAPPDPEAQQTRDLVSAIQAQSAQEVAGDLFAAYSAAVREAEGFAIDQAAVQAVQAQLLGN